MRRYTPEVVNIVTSLDEQGAILDIPRIQGEDLYSYQKRIYESSERFSNSTYEGLINALNRELGLSRKDIIEVSIKKLSQGRGTDVNLTTSTLEDTRSFTGTINGSGVKAVGNKLSDTGQSWTDNELKGMVLTIAGENYKVLSNTQQEVIFNGDVSAVVGEDYLIRTVWERNSLIGMSLVMDGYKFPILTNTENLLQVETNKLQEYLTGEYWIEPTLPRVSILSSKIVLYQEYLNEENFQLDIEIPLRNEPMDHSDIVEKINTSRFFEATDLIPLSDSEPVVTIKKQDSDVLVETEIIPGSKFFRLANKDIKEGTIQFSESSVFFREVSDVEAEPNGPYFSVNYKEGIVRSKNLPSGSGTVRYKYSTFPFRIESAPASVVSFSDDNAQEFLFAQQEKITYDDPRDKLMSSQPKSKMIEYISELQSITRQSWGE